MSSLISLAHMRKTKTFEASHNILLYAPEFGTSVTTFSLERYIPVVRIQQYVMQRFLQLKRDLACCAHVNGESQSKNNS